MYGYFFQSIFAGLRFPVRMAIIPMRLDARNPTERSMRTFGEELSRLMTDKKLSQAAVAASCEVNQTFISKLVRGESTRLGADVLYRLCHALGVPCDHFRPFLAADLPAPKKTKPKKKSGRG